MKQARVRLEELQVDYEQFEGGGTARGLGAGGLFKLSGHARHDLDREITSSSRRPTS